MCGTAHYYIIRAEKHFNHGLGGSCDSVPSFNFFHFVHPTSEEDHEMESVASSKAKLPYTEPGSIEGETETPKLLFWAVKLMRSVRTTMMMMMKVGWGTFLDNF